MGQTTNLKLPYPELSDTPDVPRDIKALAEALDSGGGARYSATLAFTANTPLVVNHDLGREFVVVHGFDAAKNGVGLAYQCIDANRVEVTSSVAGNFTVLVMG